MENTEIKNSTTFIECDVIMLKKAKRDYNGKHITLLGLVKNTLDYGESNDDFHNAAWAIQQDLYVLSEDEPQEGDFYYNPEINSIQKHLGGSQSIIIKRDYCKKVIATTNIELKLPIPESLDMYPMSYSPKSLPNVSNEFVQKYIHEYNKGLPIKKVLVEFENTQSCSLYPEKCCGNPLECKNEGECVNLQNLFVSKDNTITTKLVEKLPKQYDEDRLFNLLQDFLTIPENSIKEHIKLWIKENLKK